MRNRPVNVLMTIYFLFALTALSGIARAGGDRLPKVEPSENAGKTGKYQCKTSHAGYNYYVYVPKSYSDTNPAGLHIFFHGQGGHGSAPNFGGWAKHFLEPYNLIGINMQYMDGDNAKDTRGKTDAAIEAVQQTIADYKVIVGRGVISSFSGGGLPHAVYYTLHGRSAKRSSEAWPFSHVALYGSNYYGGRSGGTIPARGGPPMTWFIGIGGKEWNMGKPILGVTQTEAMKIRLQAIKQDGCMDVFYNYTKEKGHSISEEDRAVSAQLFRRSDLAFCPFLLEDAFEDRSVRRSAHYANRLQLGKALKSLARMLEKDDLDADVRAQATALQGKIEAREKALFDVAKELAAKDVVLANYYGPIYVRQLKGHPADKDDALEDLLRPAQKEARKARKILEVFIQEFPRFFAAGSGNLNDDKQEILEKLKEEAGAESSIGHMAADILGGR